MKIADFLENDYNANTTYHSLWTTTKAAFRRKHIAFTTYVDIKNRIKMNQTCLLEIQKRTTK